MPRAKSPAKPPLTRELILAEAVTFADEHGVDALTMRALAERLETGAMSLYNHVANKDDMIEGMVDAICVGIDRPVPTDDWQDALRHSAASAHEVLLAHPWAAAEWTVRRPGPARIQYMEALLRTLSEAGLSPTLVYHGYHAVTMHLVGFTIQELGYDTALGDGDLAAVAGDFLAGLEVGDLPHLTAHVEAHLDDQDHGDEFGFVLDLILDGLDRANTH